MVVTVANKSPATLGAVENNMESEVAVAEVTVPTAFPSNSTVLLLAVVSKPKPVIISVVESAASKAVLLVITGMTVATFVDPLTTPLVVTTAVIDPAAVGLVVRDTVNRCAVALVTVPTDPLTKATVLLPAVASKPVPLILSVAALAARFAKLAVTMGTTVATWTAAPLFSVAVVTIAVRIPAALGGVTNSTIS